MNSGKEKLRSLDLELLLAFLLPLVFLSLLAFLTIERVGLVSPAARELSTEAMDLITGPAPAAFDSRLFTLPLHMLLQFPLLLFLPASSAFLAPVIISVLASAGSFCLLVYAGRTFGLPALPRWLMALVFILNPYILVESINGSGVSLSVFLYTWVLFSVSHWLEGRGWLMLSFLGIFGGLAVITNIYTIDLLAAALILVLVNAFLEIPVGSRYAEHIFILAATPVLYAFFIRLSFTFARYGDLSPLFRLDNLVVAPLDLGISPIAIQDLSALPPLLINFLDWVWVVFPLFFIISAVYLLIAAIKLCGNGIFLLIIAWLPAIFSIFDPPSRSIGAALNRFLLLIIPAGLMLVLLIIRKAGVWNGILALIFIVLLIFSNTLSVLTICSLPGKNIYSTYLDAWIGDVLPSPADFGYQAESALQFPPFFRQPE